MGVYRINLILGHSQWRWKLENFEEDGDKKIGVKGVYTPSKTHRFWSICLLYMENFLLFFIFSFLFFIFFIVLPPLNFFFWGGETSPALKILEGHISHNPVMMGTVLCSKDPLVVNPALSISV